VEEVGNARLDLNKLELRIIQEGGKARLFYQKNDIKDSIPATTLPPFGQLISIKIGLLDKQQINFIFQLFYAGRSIGDNQRFTWTHAGEALLNTIKDPTTTKTDIEKLITQENINYHDVCGNSPLSYAVQRGDTDIVKLLLEKKATPIAPDCLDFSPLHIAVKNGNKDLVDLLLQPQYHADIKATVGGATLLKVATKEADNQKAEMLPLFESLINNGIDVNQADNEGITPLWDAMLYNNEPLIDLLKKNGATIDKSNKNKTRSLIDAVKDGNEYYAKELLKENPVAVNQSNDQGNTPLIEALRSLDTNKKSKAFVKLFLNYGADVNQANNRDTTPLMIAAWQGDHEIVELLLTRGARVTQVNTYGETALINATIKGNKKIVDLLISKGANVNHYATNMFAEESTPLLSAVYHRNKEIVELLLNHGADINQANNRGKTPLQLAQEKGLAEIVELLQNKN